MWNGDNCLTPNDENASLLWKNEQIVRGSVLRNLIVANIPRTWNKRFLGRITADLTDLHSLFISLSLSLFWILQSTAHRSHLPPFEGLVGEAAVLPGHQRVDGLVEALGKPGIVLQLRHALVTATQALVGQAEGILEEVERGVPESVAEQEHGERNDAKQQNKIPDFPPLREMHVVASQSCQSVSKGDVQK